MTSDTLIQTSDPPLSEMELELIEATVQRAPGQKRHKKRVVGQPIFDAQLPHGRECRLLSIATARIKESGIKRWERKRDYSDRRR